MTSSECENVFELARNNVEDEINQFIQCLNEKKIELFRNINSLESRYVSKQKQKQIDLERLTALKSQAEELAQNSLVGVQQKLLENLNAGIDNLNTQISPPEIKIKLGLSRVYFTTKMRNSHLQVANIGKDLIAGLSPIVIIPNGNVQKTVRKKVSDSGRTSPDDWRIRSKLVNEDSTNETQWGEDRWDIDPTPRVERVYAVENYRKDKGGPAERRWRENIGEKQVFVSDSFKPKSQKQRYNANKQRGREMNSYTVSPTLRNSSLEPIEREDCDWGN